MKDNKQSPILPLAGYVLLEPMEPENKTESGLYRPDSAKEELPQGRVLRVGSPEIREMPFEKEHLPKVGDVVIYKKYGDQDISYKGKEYKLVPFVQLIGVISG